MRFLRPAAGKNGYDDDNGSSALPGTNDDTPTQRKAELTSLIWEGLHLLNEVEQAARESLPSQTGRAANTASELAPQKMLKERTMSQGSGNSAAVLGAASWTCQTCAMDNTRYDLACWRCRSPIQEKGGHKGSSGRTSWTCQTCGMNNTRHDLECWCCRSPVQDGGHRRSPATISSETTAASTARVLVTHKCEMQSTRTGPPCFSCDRASPGPSRKPPAHDSAGQDLSSGENHTVERRLG